MSQVKMKTVEVPVAITPGGNVTGENFPIYNICPHTFVDLSHLQPGTDEWLHTFSIKLPNERHVTLCVMQTAPNEVCVDVQFYKDGERTKAKAIGFADGTSQCIKDMNLYAVVVNDGGNE
jgi:hypothetical protein